jgi:hypothetical protein
MIETATDTLVKRLLHPDDFGWSVTAEVRDAARMALRSTRYDLYLCGPMTGRPHLNRPAFFRAARELRRMDYSVFNPAENGLPSDSPWEQHMRMDIAHLVRCEALVCLPGCEGSRGAQIEIALARWLKMPVKPLEALMPEGVA